MIEEALLGFDVRRSGPAIAGLWEAPRREVFLVRLDAQTPLSVDPMVWPSAFDTGQGIGLPQSERKRLHLAGLPAPTWTGPNAGLWDDVERMRQHLAQHQVTPFPHAVVAISWFSDRGLADASPIGPHLGPVSPDRRHPDWPLLGYDVADGSLVSGLANCGYDRAQAPALRARWSSTLNARHLLVKTSDAFQFRDLANARVPEHAPFFVYGIFVVNEVG